MGDPALPQPMESNHERAFRTLRRFNQTACRAVGLVDNWLAIRRLELTVYTDNDRAIRLYERFGFEREGIMRAYAFRAGGYADVIAMARVRG